MADDTLIVRPTLLARVLKSIGLLPTGELEFTAGADYSAHQPAEPQYPKGNSMSAFAAFPFVYACVDAISSDLSGLPIRVIRGTGEESEVDSDHPFNELMESPSSRVSSRLFRRQMVTDYALTGDAYALIAGDGEPQALLRMAPQRVRVVPWTDGQPGAYEYDSAGGRRSYDYSEVMHLRSPSWEDDPSSLYGTGAIRPLDSDLRTEKAAVDSAADTATIGRPSGIISPHEDGDRWSAEQIKRMRAAYEKQLKGQSGVLFLGGAANFQQLAWSPRDLEFVEQRKMTRESVLAVFSVPPTRVGLPSANYATAREQARMYWTSLQGKAAMIDAELTRVARMFPNSENVRVVHDFAAVEALQESRTERVARVQTWWNMGLDLQSAATVEGFEELPEVEELLPDVEEEQEQEDEALKAIGELFAPESTKSAPELITRSEILDRYYDPTLELDEYPQPENREERLMIWRSYITRLHGPAERLIRSRMSKFLAAQKRRFVRRLKAKDNQKSIEAGGIIARALTQQDIDEIMDELAELERMKKAVGPMTRTVTAAAFKTTAKQMGVKGLSWDPVRRQQFRDQQINRMAEQLTKSTIKGTREVVRKGIAQGLPVRDIAKMLDEDSKGLFGRARSLRIARTEATRLTNASSLAGMDEAREMGITVWKMWDTAGDDLVRDSHAALDGVVVDSYSDFETTFVDRDGNSQAITVQQPATSSAASFDVNCRCNLVPFIDRSEADKESARRTDKDNPREF